MMIYLEATRTDNRTEHALARLGTICIRVEFSFYAKRSNRSLIGVQNNEEIGFGITTWG